MLEEAKKQLLDYTSAYLKYDQEKRYLLKLKHTLRVTEQAGEIARSLSLCEEDVLLAQLCGLLHDIGRFEQIRVYHTLQDKRSIDHGDLGVMILNQQDFLSRFWKEKMDREVILQSVKYHNKLAIPKGMNERSRLFLQITKDADKIDIFRMIAEEQIPLDIKMDSFSKPVFARLLNQKPVNLLDVTTKADSLGVWLGFFYDFSFAYSRHLMEKEGWLFQLIKEYQEKAQNQELIEQLDCVKKKVLSYTKQKEEQRC